MEVFLLLRITNSMIHLSSSLRFIVHQAKLIDQTKRKKHNKPNRPTTHYLHITQIYILWILGQVCRPQFYTNEISISTSFSIFTNLTIDLGWPCKTCDMLPLSCQVSKRISSWYQTIGHKILPNTSSEIHPSPTIPSKKRSNQTAFFHLPRELIQLHRESEELS